MNVIKKKTIVIFGGTGSFGNAFLEKAIKLPFKEIKIFSRDEKKQNDQRILFNNKKIKFIIGDVRDKDSVKNVTEGVDYVFHAAALKQVPSCEFYPMEAVKTNILGTENIINSCIENEVKKVICLSTDKAVYPINAMGMSKALMEKIVIAKSREIKNNKTSLCITRYGNVLLSRGSVIPMFVSQILKKEKINITNPSMTRFLMSLDEAIDLVLFAIENAKNGQIIIPKTKATTLEILALAVMNIYKYPNTMVKIIGTRHGEKLHETLMNRQEYIFSSTTKKYFLINSDQRDLNYNLYFSEGKKDFNSYQDYTSSNTSQLNLKQTINLLKPLILNIKNFL
jgi:UDP-glucose 4-epimerase